MGLLALPQNDSSQLMALLHRNRLHMPIINLVYRDFQVLVFDPTIENARKYARSVVLEAETCIARVSVSDTW